MKEMRERITHEILFFDDFDANGVGINTGPFDSWSTGGNGPPGFAAWSVFPGDNPIEKNLTPGNGNYAAIRTFDSSEFGDNVYWLTSPLIDTRNYNELTLSFDVYHRPGGAGSGESTLRIVLLRAGDRAETIGVIGKSSSSGDDSKSEHMSLNISPGADFMRLAFVYHNSSNNPEYDSIQLDNVRMAGKRGWPRRPFRHPIDPAAK
jgi:hypothetical protein